MAILQVRAVCPVGQGFLTASRDRTAKVWTEREAHTFDNTSTLVSLGASLQLQMRCIKLTQLIALDAVLEGRSNGAYAVPPHVQVGHEDYVVAVACMPLQTSAAYTEGAYVTGEVAAPGCAEKPPAISNLMYQDDNLLATGSRDKLVIVWDAASAQPIRKLQGHKWQVTAVAVLPGGGIVSASQDGYVSQQRGFCGGLLRAWGMSIVMTTRELHLPVC